LSREGSFLIIRGKYQYGENEVTLGMEKLQKTFDQKVVFAMAEITKNNKFHIS
jgi:hypothetical protein